MRRGLVLLILVAGLLAGCASKPEPFPEPVFEPYTDPAGDVFADSRHCYAYSMHTFVLAADLVPFVPAEWSFENPLAPEVRVVLHRCIEDFALLVSVAMRTGAADDVTAARVDFLLELFTNTTDDGWAQMGAPVRPATVTPEFLGNDNEVWRIVTEAGQAVRFDVVGKGSQNLGRTEVHGYAAGADRTRSWATEQGALSRPVQVSVEFGPGSLLKDANDVPVTYPSSVAKATPNWWWGAFNAEYRLGSPP